MKLLLLMRHADALSPELSGTDFDRILSPIGLNQATEAGKFIAANFTIDKVITSPSKRTLQTISTIMKQCNITDTLSEIPIDPKVQIHNLYSNRQASIKSIESNLLLYRGDDEKIIQLIQEELDETNSLMILGHNPTISKIAMDLVATSNGSYDNSIPHTMTTASIVVLEFPNLQKWEDLRPGTGIMRHIYTPQT